MKIFLLFFLVNPYVLFSQSDVLSSQVDSATKSNLNDSLDYPANNVDQQSGFRDIKLEESITGFSKKISIDEGYDLEGLTVYNVVDKKFKMYKGCCLETVFFETFNNKIARITIATKQTEPNCILRLLKGMYGQCSQCYEGSGRYTWIGKKFTVNFQINSAETITSISSVTLLSIYEQHKVKI